MIKELRNIPNTMVGFVVSDEVTKEDFDSVVLPAVQELVQRTNKLNYLLVVDTSLKNFQLGAWLRDAMLGLNNIDTWNRASIVSDSEGIKWLTELFSKVVPGQFKGFEHNDFDKAIKWASE